MFFLEQELLINALTSIYAKRKTVGLQIEFGPVLNDPLEALGDGNTLRN